MCIRHKSRFRLRNTAVCKTFLRPLIDGVMHRAEERIRHVARIPPKRRPICLDKRGICAKRRNGTLFCRLEDKPCRRRLADTRRSIEKEMLRIGRGEFCHKRTHGTLLSDDLIKLLRAQKLHHRLGEMHFFQCLQCLTFLLVMRRLRAGTLLRDHLPTDVVHILLMIFFEFLVYLALNAILKITPCKNPRNLFCHTSQNLGQLRLRRRRREQRVFFEDAHKGKDTFAAILRAHECHRVHLARLNHQSFRPHRVGEHPKDRCNLCIDLCLLREGRTFFPCILPTE